MKVFRILSISRTHKFGLLGLVCKGSIVLHCSLEHISERISQDLSIVLDYLSPKFHLVIENVFREISCNAKLNQVPFDV